MALAAEPEASAAAAVATAAALLADLAIPAAARILKVSLSATLSGSFPDP